MNCRLCRAVCREQIARLAGCRAELKNIFRVFGKIAQDPTFIVRDPPRGVVIRDMVDGSRRQWAEFAAFELGE